MFVWLRCKQWQCQYCADVNRKMWRASIIDTLNRLGDGENSVWSFITLTSRKDMRGFEKSEKCLKHGWKKLYDRMRRRYGKQPYIKVYEMHQDKTLHIHALVRGAIEKRWLKDTSVAVGMGYMVDCQHIDGHAGYVAAYVTKYMTKVEHRFPKGFRRIQGSREFTLKRENEVSSDKVWEFIGHYSETAMRADLSVFSEVKDIGNDMILDEAYIELYDETKDF